MKSFDDIYIELGERLLFDSVPQNTKDNIRAKYADGEKATTSSLEGVSFCITPSMGVPLLRSKRVPVKTPLIELEWIWQEMSNEVSWLNERGVHIWDEWAMEDGTIGTAYGYQLSHQHLSVTEDNDDISLLNQVDYVIHQLKNNPSSRRIMTSLWGVSDLYSMALEPCVWATHWTVHGGKLNLHVKQRSADFCLGLPFNVYQYHVLHAYVAKLLGIELGNMYWNVDNLHIYDRHVDTLAEQMLRYEIDMLTKGSQPTAKLQFPDSFDHTDYYANRLSDIKIVDYHVDRGYKYEIAI